MTDASEYAVGCMLSQSETIKVEIGTDRTITYASRCMEGPEFDSSGNPRERKIPNINREEDLEYHPSDIESRESVGAGRPHKMRLRPEA